MRLHRTVAVATGLIAAALSPAAAHATDSSAPETAPLTGADVHELLPQVGLADAVSGSQARIPVQGPVDVRSLSTEVGEHPDTLHQVF